MLSEAEANEQLEGELPDGSDGGWFALGLDLNPITLGLLVVFQPFADWYARRFPEHAKIVDEIRSMSEENAFAEIRRGRWIEVQHYDAEGRIINESGA